MKKKNVKITGKNTLTEDTSIHFPRKPSRGMAVKKIKLTSYYTHENERLTPNKMIRELYLYRYCNPTLKKKKKGKNIRK